MGKSIWNELAAAPFAALAGALIGAGIRLRSRTRAAAYRLAESKNKLSSAVNYRDRKSQEFQEQKRALDEQRSLLQQNPDYAGLEAKFALLTAANAILEKEIATEGLVLETLIEYDEATWAFIGTFEDTTKQMKDRINFELAQRPPDNYHYLPNTYRATVDSSSYPANQFDWSPIPWPDPQV